MQSNKISIVYTSSIDIAKGMEISLRISDSYGFVDKVEVCFNRHGNPPGSDFRLPLQYVETEQGTGFSWFKSTINMQSLGYYAFYLKVVLNRKAYWILEDSETGEPVLVPEHATGYNYFECFVYKAFKNKLERVKGGVMYHIYVDTYRAEQIPEELRSSVVSWSTFPKWKPDADGEYRNTQRYGGNIRGIIKMLPYIKSLGVTVIYLSPVFESIEVHGYDITDYERISKYIGTWEDLAELKRLANSMGMDLVLDVVFNHSSSQNRLVTEDPEIYGGVENYWWGYKTLRVFASLTDKYFAYLKRWLLLYAEYCDGLRIDVADSLPDEVLKFIRDVFPGYILLEVWKNAVTGDFRGFLTGEEGDGVMNYPFANAIYKLVRWNDKDGFNGTVKPILKLYPPHALESSPIFLDSHDTPRMPNILTNELMKPYGTENVWDIDKDPMWTINGRFDTYFFRSWSYEHDSVPEEKWELLKNLRKKAIFMQYTLPGLPSIFAGDEVGVEGLKDPFNRKPFPWERVNPNNELLKFYREIGAFRNRYQETFADSSNFKPGEVKRSSATYSWNDMHCYVNLTGDYQILPYGLDASRIIFTTDDHGFYGRSGDVIRPHEAVAIA